MHNFLFSSKVWHTNSTVVQRTRLWCKHRPICCYRMTISIYLTQPVEGCSVSDRSLSPCAIRWNAIPRSDVYFGNILYLTAGDTLFSKCPKREFSFNSQYYKPERTSVQNLSHFTNNNSCSEMPFQRISSLTMAVKLADFNRKIHNQNHFVDYHTSRGEC